MHGISKIAEKGRKRGNASFYTTFGAPTNASYTAA